MIVSSTDRNVIRELARQIADIAAMPVQQETIRLWKALNDLKPERPMVMIDQIPWHEMNVDGELTLQAEDDFCRNIEQTLRRTLYSWNHMRGDMVIRPIFDVPKVINGMNFGIQVVEETVATDARNAVVSHHYVDQLATGEDLEKIRMPHVELDEAATARAQAAAEELLGDILTVRMQGPMPMFAPWDRIVEWCGPEDIIMALIDRPEFVHNIVSRLTNAHLSMLDQLEGNGLLGFDHDGVHCTGAYTDDLPAEGFDPAKPRAKDIWTFGMAQIFSTVSPAVHQEFELDYAVKWYSRFGLVHYGCCEPLDDKMDIVRKIPNLRKISMSPWVDVSRGAERIGSDFVFSRKPSPALLAGDIWDPNAVASDLEETVSHCAQNNCPVELILKDISTVCSQPQRLWECADVAMRVVGA